MVYLQELDFEMGISQYPVSFSEAMNCRDFEKWKKRCHKGRVKIDRTKQCLGSCPVVTRI